MQHSGQLAQPTYSSTLLVRRADLAHGRIVEPAPLFGGTESQDILIVRRHLALHNGTKASIFSPTFAEVAELVDAHDSGSCGGHLVEVRVLSSALSTFNELQSLGITAIPHLLPHTPATQITALLGGLHAIAMQLFF